MKILQSPVFILCSVLFVLHQLLQKGLGLHIPYLHAYLDNFLAMPIILTLLLAERRLLFRKGNGYILTALDVLLATLYVSLISELLFPLFSDRFTTDWLDPVLYGLGSLLFYFTINQFPSNTRGGKVIF